MRLPIHERYPGTAQLALAGIEHVPTPVDDATRAVPGVGRLWVKRDDLTSPAYGGNKVRKLEFLLGEALAGGAKTVLTFGAYGSNHALATAVHARALGLEPHVVLSPQEVGPYAPATLLAHAGLGTQVHLVDGWDGRREAVMAKQALEQRDGVGPYIIPMGGTCALGAVGYVNAALELVDQWEGEAPADAVYAAAGTLGTVVGLALGFAAAGWPTRVEAIRVTPLEICSEQLAESLVAETVGLLQSVDATFPPLKLSDLNLTLRHEFFEPGYGVVTPETTRAVALARDAGYRLETTYTGKAFSAVIADAEEGRLSGDSVVFWDTYNSAPYPEAGDISVLPPELREYIAECRRQFPNGA